MRVCIVARLSIHVCIRLQWLQHQQRMTSIQRGVKGKCEKSVFCKDIKKQVPRLHCRYAVSSPWPCWYHSGPRGWGKGSSVVNFCRRGEVCSGFPVDAFSFILTVIVICSISRNSSSYGSVCFSFFRLLSLFPWFWPFPFFRWVCMKSKQHTLYIFFLFVRHSITLLVLWLARDTDKWPCDGVQRYVTVTRV